ncbi:hypothetical protein D3C72_2111110 [compost metagenome]
MPEISQQKYKFDGLGLVLFRAFRIVDDGDGFRLIDAFVGTGGFEGLGDGTRVEDLHATFQMIVNVF